MLLTYLIPPSLFAQDWQMQYFYDQDKSELTINDLKFPSAKRGIAAGYTTEKEKNKPVVLVTIDGGEHWTLSPVQEMGLSLYFLDDSIGWMVTAKGLWKTEESGRSWRKIKDSPKDCLRVWFVDKNHGFLIGLHKEVYESNDGGASWAEVPAALEPKANPQYTTYGCITFMGPKIGFITGWNSPPRARGRVPDWMDPQTAQFRRQWPSLSIILETRDGGTNWKPSTASIFGRMTRVALAPPATGLALVEFTDAFEWPSEVYSVNLRDGVSKRVFREKKQAISDVAIRPDGTAYLSGEEITVWIPDNPIPSKVRVFRSSDLNKWEPMTVDYRAVAHRTMLAAADDQNIWMATDMGMILKLQRR